MILPFALLAIFSLAMVGAMVQFSYAIVSDDPRQAENRTLWGAIYLALWVGILIALWDLIRHDRELTASDWAALAIAPVGWLTFNALWAALLGALEIHDAEQKEKQASPRSIVLKRTGGRLTFIGLAIVAGLLVVLGAPQAFFTGTIRSAPPLLTAVVAMMVAGWALLIWGGVRLALGVGDTKIEDRRLGTRISSSGEVDVTFREFKNAWRDGLWIRDPRWRTIYMMGLGAIFLAYGLFGLFVVQGPIPVRLLCAGALGYATVRTVAGFWKA